MKPIALFPKVGAALTIVGGLTLTALPSTAVVVNDFTGDFAPDNWSDTTGSAAGTADFNDTDPVDMLTFAFESGAVNDYVERTILVNFSPLPVLIKFSWFFESLGLTGSQSAGYVVNNVYTPLAAASLDEWGDPIPSESSQPVSVTVNNGQTFGFRYTALQNTSSEGFFDVTEFSAEPVPFESDVLPLVGATILFGGAMWWKRKRAEKSLNEFNANEESVNN